MSPRAKEPSVPLTLEEHLLQEMTKHVRKDPAYRDTTAVFGWVDEGDRVALFCERTKTVWVDRERGQVFFWDGSFGTLVAVLMGES